MDIKKITEEILNYWQENEIEKKVLETDPKIEKARNKKDYPLWFNFYDGPPFASGDPHYGHLLASTIKDLIPRYMYMRGYFVPRRWGWDCHGLPAEGYVEKKLGVRGKKEIEEKIGIDKFVEACRTSVMQVNDNWKRFISHLGRWIDITRAYFTMDLDFMESVIWVFSNMYSKNFIYKSFKIQGYCPNCATPLSAYEISQGYKDKQDKAITVKFSLSDENEIIPVVAGIIEKNGKYLMLYDYNENSWYFPGGKVKLNESLENALKRELKEELGIEIKDNQYIGVFPKIVNGKVYKIYYFKINKFIGEPKIQEKEIHSKLGWVNIEEADNTLGFKILVKFETGESIIQDNESIIKKEFYDMYMINKGQNYLNISKNLEKLNLYFLAWTTTPWTLPSNMFLAVNPQIKYVLIFDFDTKEFYILAKDLLKRYYKNEDNYFIVEEVLGKDLISLRYSPLFDYYLKSTKIESKYKNEVFKVLSGDFVSTESGTGIVHIAPAFGEDDWNIVVFSNSLKIQTNDKDCLSYEECKLPAEGDFKNNISLFRPENANKWLFLPLNEYAEYTEEVYDYKGIQVFKANEKIIQDLKNRKLIVKIESITHSYPHCRRCDTPLIYRAIDSWFIKVNKEGFKNKLLNEAEEIYFVPESVKNRFKKGIEQAPDWNISRNRYWGAPLPVWEPNKDIKDIDLDFIKNKLDISDFSVIDNVNKKIIVGSLDDLYKFTKTGSKNLSRFVLQRHGETDFNIKHWADSRGDAILTENGKKQAENLVNKYFNKFGNDFKNGEYVIVVSPLQRTFQTIELVIKELINKFNIDESFEKIKENYYKIANLYKDLWNKNSISLINLIKDKIDIKEFKEFNNLGDIQNIGNTIFKISDKMPIYIDFRITDHISPSIEGKEFHCETIKFDNSPIANDPNGESALDVYNRVVEASKYWNLNNMGKTVIFVSHGDPIVMIRKALRNFDRDTRKYDFYPSRGQFFIHYIRDEKDFKEVDLHRPYIDSHWFEIEGVKFERIKEILDCWFESGSMPYGQDHYPFD